MPLFSQPPAPWYLAHREMITAQTAGESTRTANATYLHDIDVLVPVVITSFSIAHGSVSAGNLDLGIYDSSGNLLAHVGATAAGAINTTQTINLASPFLLSPGRYFLAFWTDSATATYFARTAITPVAGFGNIKQSVGTNAGGLAATTAGMGGIQDGQVFVPFLAHLQGTGF